MSDPYTVDRALAYGRLRFGSRAHVVDDVGRASFASLDDAATRAAEALRVAGLRPGGRVALRIANRAVDLAAAFGVWRAGGVLVPLNPRFTDEEEAAIAERADAALVVAVATDGTLRIAPRAAAAEACDEGLAAIAFTSGTTGSPKGVEITHSNMLWAAAAVMHTRRDTPDAVAAMVSPICHLPVLVSHYLARLLSGGTVVAGVFEAKRVAALIAEHGITDLPLVPAMIAPLLDEASLPDGYRVRKVTVGSAVTTMETKRALAARFRGAEILEAYGQTESTDGITMTSGLEALERPGTVGRAHTIVPVAVTGPDGRLLGAGEPGEVVCRGPTVMRGYHRDPEATAVAVRDGWLHTGDLGFLDDSGCLFLTGRLKEIIITGGENVSPEEVEGVLLRHPAVAEAAVFGAPDPRWGEAVAAAVVVREVVSADALRDHVGHHLARFKCPRRIFFVQNLPKTAAGKVRRRVLRDELLGGES